MAFDIDFEKRGQLKLHIRKFLLYPIYWTDINNHFNYKLNWKSIKFNKRNLRRLPDKKGIYCFVVIPNYPNFFKNIYLFYVGQTTRTLKERFREYINDQAGKGKPRPKIFEMLSLYKDCLYFYYASINSESQIDEVEKKLLNSFVPHINTDVPIAKIKKELSNIYE